MQKPKVAKAFSHLVRNSGSLHFACEILWFCALRVRFCISPRFCERRISIEVMAVWLCTAFFPLLGNRTCGPLTKQGGNRRVNRIPQNKLPEAKSTKVSHPPTALLRLSLFPPPKNPLFPAFVAFTPAPLLALLKLFLLRS